MALHTTVLREEAVTALSVESNGFYIDTTFGRGGHASAVLERLSAQGRLLVLDRDPEAIKVAKSLSEQDARVAVEYSAFSQLGNVTQKHGVKGAVNGILFDLGVSSPQLDDPARGFSFMRDGPLDMRMDREGGVSAEEWIHSASESDIADVIWLYGEERHSRRIAKAISAARSEQRIKSTEQLAQIIKQAHPAWEKDRHPATKTFQAIRIKINDELDELESGLKQAVENLAPNGRLVAISFHSLEDRIVKRFINEGAKGDSFPKGVPVTTDQLKPSLKKIGKAIKPSLGEVEFNPRARSATMRIAEKIA